jgi:hypothetical protein
MVLDPQDALRSRADLQLGPSSPDELSSPGRTDTVVVDGAPVSAVVVLLDGSRTLEQVASGTREEGSQR